MRSRITAENRIAQTRGIWYLLGAGEAPVHQRKRRGKNENREIGNEKQMQTKRNAIEKVSTIAENPPSCWHNIPRTRLGPNQGYINPDAEVVL